MRIIGGRFKGRRFYPPAKNWPTRPTTDFSKEALYNILANRIQFEEIVMLDLFGGTGNHCYEFISRGCKDTTYVDKHGPCLNFVKKISSDLDVTQNIRVIKMDVKKFIKSTSDQFDFIFAGPPYGLDWLDEIPNMIFTGGLLNEGGLLVLEHNQHHNFEDHPHYSEMRSYGQTKFSFFNK